MPVPAELVATPDAVTPGWLTDVLRRCGVAPPGTRVVDLATETIGTGQVGRNVRFTLSWSGGAEGLPATVVGKFAAADETSRMAGLLTGTYVREVHFYRELADRCAMRIPRCHVAELDPSSGAFVLLFEDIAPARQGDQIAGCTVDEAALAMEELARLHASFWADPGLADRSWLVRRNADSAGSLASLYDGFAPQFLERYGERLDDTTCRTVESLRGRVTEWLATDRPPLTLLHTDYRLDNLLFGTGPGAPPLTVVDWQTPAIGAGVSDAAYFLGGGLPVELRRTHERDLLEHYRSGLDAAGVALGAEACWNAYRANAFAGLHMTVVASMLVGRHDRGDTMFCTMAERHAAHIDDLDAFGAIGAPPA